MQHEFAEEDLALVHALQLHPRVSWTALAPVLDASAGTLARRWERLRCEGLAWVTTYPSTTLSGSALTALVEVDCAPGALDAVSTRLDHTPHVASVEHAARGRDLILTVFARSFADMSALLLDELSRLPGVVSTRAHIAARVHIEGSRWRLGALDTDQRAAIRAIAAADERRGAPVDLSSPVFAPLARELSQDGRAGAAAVAERVGRPTSTVRRQLGALVASRSLTFRCDVAQLLTRWPICVTWWCRVPGTAIDVVVAQLRQEARIRLCLSLTGPANFLVTAWTSSLADLTQLQTWLESVLTGGEVVDASVILRTRKRMGWLLHPDGRCTGEVVPLAAAGGASVGPGGSPAVARPGPGTARGRSAVR